MAGIPVGSKQERTVLVTSEAAISFLGIDGARVLGTPHMIGLMERACRDLLLEYLDPGYDSVGTHVDVYHRDAAPLGSSVVFRAEILSVQERRVNFQVACVGENGETVGDGTHERFIIHVARFAAKMQEKLAKK